MHRARGPSWPFSRKPHVTASLRAETSGKKQSVVVSRQSAVRCSLAPQAVCLCYPWGGLETGIPVLKTGLRRNMRILHVDSARTWRGGQNQVLLTAQGMKLRGHDVAVAACRGGALETRARAAGIGTCSISFHGDLSPAAVYRDLHANSAPGGLKSSTPTILMHSAPRSSQSGSHAPGFCWPRVASIFLFEALSPASNTGKRSASSRQAGPSPPCWRETGFRPESHPRRL